MSRPRPLSKDEGEILRESFYYKEGLLYAKSKYSVKTKFNTPLGCDNGAGYLCVRCKGRCYLVHRIIFFLETGEWPVGVVDHINCNKRDNRIENLRHVTQMENTHSFKGGHRDSSSKFRGVSFYNRVGKYTAKIYKGGVAYHLGYFTCEREAALAYNYKAIELGFPKQSYNIVFKDKE